MHKIRSDRMLTDLLLIHVEFPDSHAILIRVEKIAICTPSRIIAHWEGKWAAKREVIGSISGGGSILKVFQYMRISINA